MAKRRGEAHGGGHGWFVTFADLMGLLVSFFVMLVAFSTQDQAKLQVVAGSMRDAFGVQDRVRYSGIIEVLGLPTRPRQKNAAHVDPLGSIGDAISRRTRPTASVWRALQGRSQILVPRPR
jgi:chemotaxis protein MotB